MQSISLLLNWWLRQLGALLPPILAGGPAALPDAFILEQDQQNLLLSVRRKGLTQRLTQMRAGSASARELAGGLPKAGRKGPRLFLIRLSSMQLLCKSLTLPNAARRNLAELLGFEIDRETPFQRDEVHWTYVVRGQDARAGLLNVDLVLVPRSAVDPLVEAARNAGLDPDGIEVSTGSGAMTLLPLGSRKRGQWSETKRPLLPLATAATILAVLAVVTPFAIQQWELSRIEARIAALEPSATEAATFRQLSGQIAATIDFLTKERSKNGSALAALAAATKSLPDDSYLSALSLRAGRLTMSGLSPSAAQLVGLLAEAPEFREPAFEAPVTRDPENELETFTISVALGSGGGP
jgi:general secretion pathway protein L